MHATEPASLRLFLALWPPRAVHAKLQAHAQQWAWPPQARRTLPERLHVTIHFLGNVPSGRLPDLRVGLQVDWPGEELLFDQAHVWGGGIAVLEASCVPPALAALHAALGERLGVNGTPTIVTENGDVVGGYVTPAQLLQALNAPPGTANRRGG